MCDKRHSKKYGKKLINHFIYCFPIYQHENCHGGITIMLTVEMLSRCWWKL